MVGLSNDDTLLTVTLPLSGGTKMECDMKRLLLGVALSAVAANSFAQTQADYEYTAEADVENSVDFNSNEKNHRYNALIMPFTLPICRH